MSSEMKVEVDQGNFEMVPTDDLAGVNQVDETLFNSPSKRQARDISWQNVNFTVGGKTKVLSNCWGKVRAGQVCAIMGPSGAGKSSLLNVLAGRSASAPGIVVEGKVSDASCFLHIVL